MTSAQRKVFLNFAALYDQLGYAPSIAQICERTGLKSKSTVWYHLRTLERNGFLRWTPRGYQLVEAA